MLSFQPKLNNKIKKHIAKEQEEGKKLKINLENEIGVIVKTYLLSDL